MVLRGLPSLELARLVLLTTARLCYINDAATGGVGLTAVELGAILFACAESHAPAAVRTCRRISFSDRRMALLEIDNMARLALLVNGSLPFSNRIYKLINLRYLYYRFIEAAHIGNGIVQEDNILRHVGFEFAVVGENDEALEIRLVDSKIIR